MSTPDRPTGLPESIKEVRKREIRENVERKNEKKLKKL